MIFFCFSRDKTFSEVVFIPRVSLWTESDQWARIISFAAEWCVHTDMSQSMPKKCLLPPGIIGLGYGQQQNQRRLSAFFPRLHTPPCLPGTTQRIRSQSILQFHRLLSLVLTKGYINLSNIPVKIIAQSSHVIFCGEFFYVRLFLFSLRFFFVSVFLNLSNFFANTTYSCLPACFSKEINRNCVQYQLFFSW